MRKLTMSHQTVVNHGGRPARSSFGRKRKGADEYAVEYPDFTCQSIPREGQLVRMLVCRFCCQPVGARSDRIKEHLLSKRHLKLKMPYLRIQEVEGVSNEVGSSSNSNDFQQQIGDSGEVINPQNIWATLLSSQSNVGGSPGVSTAGNGSPSSVTPGNNFPPACREDGQAFHIRWGNFNSNLITMFTKMRIENQFVDVTLFCNGKSIKCHKIVLSANSMYFERLLTEELLEPYPVICISKIRTEIMEALVDFMYQGKISVHPNTIEELLHAAETLKIKGLVVEVDEEWEQTGTDEGTYKENVEMGLDLSMPKNRCQNESPESGSSIGGIGGGSGEGNN